MMRKNKMTFITEEANHNSKWYNTIKDTDL